jgi:hypothetical protein
MSAGTDFAKMVRKYFSIGPRTRNYRKGQDLKKEILEAIAINNSYPGYYSETQAPLFQSAYSAMVSIEKHIIGGRFDPVFSYEVEKMSPWQYAAMVGEMIDAGVSNTYEGEQFFKAKRQEMYARAA